MTKRKLFLTLIFASCSLIGFGQFSVGLKAGANTNDLYFKGDIVPFTNVYSSTLGYHIGAVVEFTLSEKFSVAIEPQFIQRGSQAHDKPNPEIRYNLNYIEVPLLISYRVGNLSVDGGASGAYLTRALGIGNSLVINANNWFHEDFTYGLVGGLRYHFSKSIYVAARYYRGLSSVAELTLVDVNTNNVTNTRYYEQNIQLSLGYRIRKLQE